MVSGAKKEAGCLFFFENAFLMMKETAPLLRVNILTIKLLSEYLILCKTIPCVDIDIQLYF
jgi:hypothetical protein